MILGRGYSSLSYLRRFPLNGLKNRSFLCNGTGASSRKSQYRAGHYCPDPKRWDWLLPPKALKTASQLATLNAMGCTYGQGYYFARPMPADEMSRFLEQQLALTSQRTFFRVTHPSSRVQVELTAISAPNGHEVKY